MKRVTWASVLLYFAVRLSPNCRCRRRPNTSIDDEDDELDGLAFFQPTSRTGLTEKIVAGVADYLNGKTDKDMRRNRLVRALQNLHSVFTGHRG